MASRGSLASATAICAVSNSLARQDSCILQVLHDYIAGAPVAMSSVPLFSHPARRRCLRRPPRSKSSTTMRMSGSACRWAMAMAARR